MPAPIQKIGLEASDGLTKSASMTLPVAPKSSAAPKSRKAVAVELRIKYLSADSRAVFRSTEAQSAYRPNESSSRPRKIAIKFAAPAISIAPHALQSMIAVVPATRPAGPIVP